MNRSDRQGRHEVATLARDAFAAYQENTAAKRSDQQNRVVNEVSSRGNIGGYLPALTDRASKQLRTDIRVLAKTFAKEFTRFGMPSDASTVIDLERIAKRMAVGVQYQEFVASFS